MKLLVHLFQSSAQTSSELVITTSLGFFFFAELFNRSSTALDSGWEKLFLPSSVVSARAITVWEQKQPMGVYGIPNIKTCLRVAAVNVLLEV